MSAVAMNQCLQNENMYNFYIHIVKLWASRSTPQINYLLIIISGAFSRCSALTSTFSLSLLFCLCQCPPSWHDHCPGQLCPQLISTTHAFPWAPGLRRLICELLMSLPLPLCERERLPVLLFVPSLPPHECSTNSILFLYHPHSGYRTGFHVSEPKSIL